MSSESIRKKLEYTKNNFWESSTKKEQKVAMKFADSYRKFLDEGKTVREVVKYIKAELDANGFHDLTSNTGTDKVYSIYRDKVVAFAKIGKKPIKEGINIIASHIDSPRVDLKQNPLSEDATTNLAIMKTHYYGGIKKYQWMSTPLALHGFLVKNDGTKVNVSIGENDNEPVFIIPDLLPHLASKVQGTKKIGEAIPASSMKVIFSSIPFIEKDTAVKEAVKLQALKLLDEKYNIEEKDFLSAEFELVPAGKSRNSGLDESMVSGYGQDDRICSYTALKALFDCDIPEKTSVVILFDKEEIGSESNTGANSIIMYDFVADLLKHNKEDYDSYTLRKTLINTQILSADVNAAINPNFPSVHEKDNACKLGYGVGITKFTGVRGKGGSNDANSEFVAKVINVLNKEKVNWQMTALGKVDEGGGGTIAKFLAESGAEVLDVGPGLLGMHSLYEVCSKADLYSTYKAYKAFFVHA